MFLNIVYLYSLWFFSLKFLDDVSSTESKEPSGVSEPVHLKEG